jgi:hypothetical protein
MIKKDTPIPNFSPEIYRRVALNELVTFSVYFLKQQGGEINAEDIVAACFKLFPERFQLRGYPEWPDSTVVNKRWLDCRDRGYLIGSTAGGFTLSAKGLELAEKAEEVLTGKKRIFKKTSEDKVGGEMRTRAGRFVRSLETSEAFQGFMQNGPSSVISEYDFRNMLLCTMESSPTTLKNNLDQFRQYCELYQRGDLVGFLDHCQQRFSEHLTESKGKSGTFRGGMNKKKLK